MKLRERAITLMVKVFFKGGMIAIWLFLVILNKMAEEDSRKNPPSS